MIQLKIDPGLESEHCKAYAVMVEEALCRLAAGDVLVWPNKRKENAQSATEEGRVITMNKNPRDGAVWERNKTARLRELYGFIRQKNAKQPLITAKASYLSRVVMEFDRKVAELNLHSSLKDAFRATMAHVFSYEHFRNNFDAPTVSADGMLLWRHGDTTDMPWGAWRFIQGLNVRYCPYCNAENVAVAQLPRYGQDKVAKLIAPALDHYFPKGRYPFLAISLYNLVPSCTRCNSVMKGAHIVNPRKEINPYRHSIAKRFEFVTEIYKLRVFSGNPHEQDVSVSAHALPLGDGRSDTPARSYLKHFRLQDIYNWSYKREILDRIIALGRYSNRFITDRNHFLPYCTDRDRDRIMFACSLDETQINCDRLSKFTIDLARQFGVKSRCCLKNG